MVDILHIVNHLQFRQKRVVYTIPNIEGLRHWIWHIATIDGTCTTPVDHN